MSGTELIMGMGEVINYLKQLEEENKKLEEKAECFEEKLMEIVDIVDIDDGCGGMVDFWDRYNPCVKKVKKLKEENSYLENWNIDKLNENYVPLEDYEKLKEENEKLKQEKDYLKINMEIENNSLEARNKKLQEEWEILNKFCSVEKKNDGQAVVDWICNFFKIEDDACALEKENKKLKFFNRECKEETERFMEENEKLKEKNNKLVELHNLVSVQANADNEELQSFIKEQEKEIEKLKEELEQEKEGREHDIQQFQSVMEEKNQLEIEVEELKEEDPDCCESCGISFDLQYTLRHADKELSKKYQEYMGSPEDCGDICQVCIMSPFRNKQ